MRIPSSAGCCARESSGVASAIVAVERRLSWLSSSRLQALEKRAQTGGFRRWRNRQSGWASEAVKATGVSGEPRSVPDRWSQRNEAADMLRRRERLDVDLALASEALERAEEQARIEREKVALIQDRLARRTALLDELSMLADQENEAQVLLRRAERNLDRRLHQRAAIDVQADRSRSGRRSSSIRPPGSPTASSADCACFR